MGRPSVREQLVARSLPVLITQGFEGARVGDLVASAGVPKGSFYNHFDSKEQFAVEQVRRYTGMLALERLGDTTDPPLTVIRRHFEQQIDARRTGELPNGCLLGSLSSGVGAQYSDLRAAVRDAFAAWIEAVTDALRRARRVGGPAFDGDPDAVAAALVDGFQGAVARACALDDPIPLEVFLEFTLPVLVTAG